MLATRPARALLDLSADRDGDASAGVAALYPTDTPAAQRLLAATAAALLRECGRDAVVGAYGVHATADIAAPGGTLVVVPMAGLADLDAELAVEDDADPAVWHLHLRDSSGALVEHAGAHGCPSVVWAVRAGIDPAAAVALVDAALADPLVRSLLGGDR